MRLQKKNNFKKTTYQIIVPIPSKLVVALDIKAGDLILWRVIDNTMIKLIRPNTFDKNIKYNKIFEQGSAKRLYVTLPKQLYNALGWLFQQQFEWKIKAGSLILKKGLTPIKGWKRQNLG